MSKSCYVLELSVSPGGARRGDVFVYNRLVHIRRCLEHELDSPDPEARAYAASLAVEHRETIALWVVEEGKLVRGIDLHPHIRLRLGDEPPVSLVEAKQRDEAYRGRLASAPPIAFEVDWDAIAVETPALRGDLLRPGEALDIEMDEDILSHFTSYLEITDELAYGYEDLDGGEPAPPGFVDPDPPS